MPTSIFISSNINTLSPQRHGDTAKTKIIQLLAESLCLCGKQVLVFRHRRIDLVAPARNAASHVDQIVKALLFQEGDGLRAAASHFTMDYNFLALVLVQFMKPVRQLR